MTSQHSKTANLTFAPFTQAELPRLDEIDRSEVVEALYRVERGALVKDDTHIDVPGWLPGDGDHSVGKIRAFAAEHLVAGAEGIMALSGDKLRGIALVGFQLSPETAQLALLDVSREARRTGVARSLCRRCYDLARGRGARQILRICHAEQLRRGFLRSRRVSPDNAGSGSLRPGTGGHPHAPAPGTLSRAAMGSHGARHDVTMGFACEHRRLLGAANAGAGTWGVDVLAVMVPA